ncbi:MAG: sensor histidine kinase [Eubacteriales bacterium]|nr:sensor histidine kinase [Eubacteriales bacterium]
MKKKLFSLYGKFVLYALGIGCAQAAFQAACYYLMLHFFGTVHPLIMDLCNLLIILILLLVIAWHYHRYLERISRGINALARGESVRLSEEGATAELARSINRTSEILEDQRETIEKRDTARMEWIRGISHDVRTPLSMVMGYSEILEEEALTDEQLHCVMIIKEQSIRMKALIEDLNLTSKLEYGSQPLRLSDVSPAELLRNSAASAMNADLSASKPADRQMPQGENVSEKYSIELLILPEFEGLQISADRSLLGRVFDNLIGNAIRHNPGGCSIVILAYKAGDRAIVEIRDDGTGIPDEVARIVNAVGSAFSPLEEETEGEETAAAASAAAAAGSGEEADGEHLQRLRTRPHIMGMRIAKQIMLAHGGNLFIKPDRHTAEVVFDLTPQLKETVEK